MLQASAVLALQSAPRIADEEGAGNIPDAAAAALTGGAGPWVKHSAGGLRQPRGWPAGGDALLRERAAS